jgi:hypothetical protein
MTKKVANRIKSEPIADIDVDQLSDDDIRQLVIHHATLLRSSHGTYEQQVARGRAVSAAWRSWPRPLWERFVRMALAAPDGAFWVQPADINNKLTPLV